MYSLALRYSKTPSDTYTHIQTPVSADAVAGTGAEDVRNAIPQTVQNHKFSFAET